VTLEVVDPGPQSSVQDVVGRRPWRRYGVPLGGAADGWSARLANRLVGNPHDAAVVEVLAPGAVVRADSATVIAITGGLQATVGGIPVPPDTARRVGRGTSIRLAAGRGLRGYLAVAGGFQVDPVLGSRATDLRTGFGGIGGRALSAGDRIGIGQAAPVAAYRWLGARPDGPLRVTPGPQADDAILQALIGRGWEVGRAVDRTGVRLEGGRVPGGGEVPSQGLVPGSVQVPPDGQPILMLADCPVTGGYRVPACIIGADLGHVAQLRPGETVALTVVDTAEARAAWRDMEQELARLEPLDPRLDHGAEWAGSHN
jgi:biotin-dependent carboxylase-like uncharacterized protein